MQSRNHDLCIDLRGRAPLPEIGAQLVKMRVYPGAAGLAEYSRDQRRHSILTGCRPTSTKLPGLVAPHAYMTVLSPA